MNSEKSEPDVSGLRSVVAGSALLGGLLLLVAACAAMYSYPRHQTDGLWAVLVAAGVCWVSASTALAITALTTGGPQAVAGMFSAMAVRMGIPIAVGLTLNAAFGRLADAGLFGLIVVHYLVALLVETILAVRIVSARSRTTR